jgi:hypothetical protein
VRHPFAGLKIMGRDMRISPIKAALWLFLLWLLSPTLPAQEIATLTLVEGPLRLIRGTMLLQGTEGIRLRAGDILESASGGFVQIEFTGGTVAALGPSTRMFLRAASEHKGGELSQLILLSGWLKGETGANAGAYCYGNPQLAATTRGGTVVMHAAGDAADIFVESGSAVIAKVSSQGQLAPTGEEKGGTFVSRRAGKGILTNPRPDSAFIDSMPRPFRDTLPSRLARFPKAVTPKRDHEVNYSDIQAWLTMPANWRKGFVERFQPRLHDAEFRKDVQAHLKDHPEWDAALHPENRPKTAPAAAADSDAAQRR